MCYIFSYVVARHNCKNIQFSSSTGVLYVELKIPIKRAIAENLYSVPSGHVVGRSRTFEHWHHSLVGYFFFALSCVVTDLAMC
jgi:hypothetical protein